MLLLPTLATLDIPMSSIYAFLLIVAGVTGSLTADVFLKRSDSSHAIDFLVGMVLYAVTAIPAALALRRIAFAPFFIVWEAIMVLAGITLAYAAYGEPMTITRAVAVAFAVAAVILSYAH